MVFGEFTLNERNIHKWHKLSEEDQEEVNDIFRPGRLITSIEDMDVKVVKNKVFKNYRIIIRKLAVEVNIATGTCFY